MERSTTTISDDGAVHPAQHSLHGSVAWLLRSSTTPDHSAEQFILAAEAVYDRLRGRLIVSLGTLGFDALWARALHITVRSAPIGESPQATSALATGPPGLRALVGEGGPDAVYDLLCAVLTSFFTVLGTFIGEPLTFRIIRQLWPTLPTAPADESSATKENDHDRV